MRLLNTTLFTLEEFQADVPNYVILSHRWEGEEITFTEVQRISLDEFNQSKEKSRLKIKGACAQAARDGYKWIWIDTCCIDRSSSAELQESINSMWSYYKLANICYAYLADIQRQEDGFNHKFSESLWWSRGWTLQELLAPDIVEFYASDWSSIGTKLSRQLEISLITNIKREVLGLESTVGECCAAEKLSWAAHRHVTRQEDEAYSLLGIFQVNLPLIYGEGRLKAFYRLQEAIFAATGDFSLFLYRYSPYKEELPFLADCPTRFCPILQCIECSKDLSTCFDQDIPYTKLKAGKGWLTQAHDNLHASVTETHLVFSGTLHLILHLAWTSMPRSEPHESMTHIAVLNCGLRDETKLKWVFCIPLQLKKAKYLDACKRLNVLPILLHWDRVKHRQSRKLICSPEIRLDTKQVVLVTFEITSESCSVEMWSHPKYPVSVDDTNEPRRSRTIESPKLAGPRQGSENHVTCVISCGTPPRYRVRVRLEQVRHSWVITKVSDVDGDGLVHTPHVSDRMTFHRSKGGKIFVRVRRLETEKDSRYLLRLHYAISIEDLVN